MRGVTMKLNPCCLVSAGILLMSAAALKGAVSVPSNVASVTTPSDGGGTTPGVPPVPNAPSSLIATASDASHVVLIWTDNSNNEVGFQIERALAVGGPWELVGTVGTNVTSFTDNGLAAATTYFYRVSAFN